MLGTYSRKNRLYQAFRESGVAVRTRFLLQYIGNAELRSTIQAATNKSESFNDFVKWLAFGGSVITENDRAEQRKIIKYNHLLANCLIFHNVCMMTRVLHKLRADGVPVEADTVAALSPYIRSHINSYLDIFGAGAHSVGGAGGAGSVGSPRSARSSNSRRLMAVCRSTSRGQPRSTASSMSCCSHASRARSRGAYSLVVKNLEHRR